MLSLICCPYRPVLPTNPAGYPVPAGSGTRGIAAVFPDASSTSQFLAQAEQPEAPEQQKPDTQQKNRAAGDTRKQQESSQPNDKKPPPKEFVPSEQIDADKAVDFPADI